METIKKLDLNSFNISEDKKSKLKEVFPEVFIEDKIDFEKLKLTLGEEIADSEERFGLQWAGKKDCFKVIQEPSVGTLKPCKEESVNWDTTENLFIEGDNLEVLKQLQKAYYGKVKMIYIDPPYNTGGEFIYPDRFQENLDTYLAYTEQVNDEGKKFSTNTETSGRFHSNWLNMIYSRLFLARNLLQNEGAIYISIDDNEIDNLKKVCNEIYGEENFISTFIWQKNFAPKNDNKYISNSTEYVLCYAKNKNLFVRNLLKRSEKHNAGYSNPDNDNRGLWTSGSMLATSFAQSGVFSIKSLNGKIHNPPAGRCWRYSLNKVEELLNDGRVWFGMDGNGVPRIKRFLTEMPDGIVPQNLLKYEDVGSGQDATKTLNNIFGRQLFDFPKPTKLIQRFIEITTKDNDIILDFFAGSGTTAHSVMLSNIENNTNKKFIVVQLPEPCDEKSEAFKAGYKTIANISQERIRRVIDKIETEVKAEELKNQGKLNLEEGKTKNKLDLGFKVFKLDRSNFKTWDGDIKNNEIQNQLEKALFHIDTNSSEEDILTEILLKSGFQLTVEIDEIIIATKKVYSIAEGSLIVCLDKDITKELIQEIAKLEPARVVCLDSGFKERDELKTNAVQIMKSHGIDDFRTV
jgi:adenine-specific DNA-methyltransferase